MNKKAIEILEDSKMNSSEKLEALAFYIPVCGHMMKMKKRIFWKLLLEDVVVLLLRENLSLQEKIVSDAIVKVPFIGFVK